LIGGSDNQLRHDTTNEVYPGRHDIHSASAQRQLTRAHSLRCLGESQLGSHQFLSAESSLNEGLALAKASGDILCQAECLRALGDVNIHLSRLQISEEKYSEALPLYISQGDRLGEAHCIKRIGNTIFCLGDTDASAAAFKQALLIYISIDSLTGQGKCLRSLGDAALLQNNPLAALAYYDEAEPVFVRDSNEVGCASCVMGRGEAHNLLGENDLAEHLLREANEVFIKNNSLFEQSHLWRSLAKISVSRGNFAEARSRIGQGLEISIACSNRLEEAHCVKDLAHCDELAGEKDASIAGFIKASRIFEEIGNLVDKAKCDKALEHIV